MNWVVCHYNEIGLKGKNRKFFEEKLIENIKRSLSPDFFVRVRRISGRILVELSEEGNNNHSAIRESLENVFGVAYFAFAENCEQKIEAMERRAFFLLKNKKFKTFKVSAQRSKKDFILGSQQINERIGAFILEKHKAEKQKCAISVNLDNPDVVCFLEIVEKYAFLFLEKIKGAGGLPVGTGGKAIVLLSGGIDSPVAAFSIIKRGVKAIFLHFHAYPYTDEASLEKTRKLMEILNKFQFSSSLYLVPFADIQKQILLKAPDRLRVILYRRFMLRIAELIAQKEGALAIVSGESVGQVASQTLENIKAVADVASLPVLRPLIGYDKEEIIKKAKEIGTFDVSILPEQDCCARFLPKYPATKADLGEVELAEKKLDIKQLIEWAVKNTSCEHI